MREWVDAPAVEVPETLRAAVGGHPLVAQTLARRGFVDVTSAKGFLDPDCYTPASPYDLPNMVRAAERVEKAIRDGETICVWGDFDVDGQTSTTLLVSTLRDLGADVRFYIPNRERESHGVSLPSLRRLVGEGVNLVLTCDTGVTDHEAIASAQAQGVDVVVTDHHDLPPVLPEAHAVVNPKMLPATHPLRELPGVGCAYKLAEALYERAGRAGDAARDLDLVALGIVVDVARQVKDTRYLLQRGLELLRHSDRLGLQVLMKTAGLNPLWLTEEHIGFELGPRLNSLGRLADANSAVEFFTTQDLTRARTLATQLEGLNARRRLLVSQVAQGALAQIERDPSLLERGALVLSHDSWPAGILGIVAGRLAERYGRPAILIASPQGEVARASARSVPGCDIRAAIATHGEMLERFGGHPMAAGLAIDRERIPAFREALSDTVQAMLAEVEEPALQIDGTLGLEELTLDLVQEIERLAPFGAGNRPLTLVTRGLQVTSERTVGRSGEHLLLMLEDEEGRSQKVVWWQGAGSPRPEGRFDLAHVLRASDYRGQREVQVQWVDAHPCEGPPVVLRPPPVELEVVDCRRVPDPLRALEKVYLKEEVQVWAEATHKAQVGGQDRNHLAPHECLVVWTTPPAREIVLAVLEQVAPQKVYVFGVDPGLDALRPFVSRMAGLIEHALCTKGGVVKVADLAAATAQRQSTVRAGLHWLRDRGYFAILSEGADEMSLQAVPAEARREASALGAASPLMSMLRETAAFRAHLHRVDEEGLRSLLEVR
jgi:single-stranded-DNA-specific exonuclease